MDIRKKKDEILRQIHGDLIPIIPISLLRNLEALTPTPEKFKSLVVFLDKGNELGIKINHSINKYKKEQLELEDLEELKNVFNEIKDLLVKF